MRGFQRGRAPAERVEHHVAGVRAGLNDPVEQGDRFLSRVAHEFLPPRRHRAYVGDHFLGGQARIESERLEEANVPRVYRIHRIDHWLDWTDLALLTDPAGKDSADREHAIAIKGYATVRLAEYTKMALAEWPSLSYARLDGRATASR